MVNTKKAFAIIEFTMLIVIIMASLYIFRDYLLRGIQGQYRKVGDTMSYQQQFNSYATAPCLCEGNFCYDQMCFDGEVGVCAPGDRTCINNAKTNCKTNMCQSD